MATKIVQPWPTVHDAFGGKQVDFDCKVAIQPEPRSKSGRLDSGDNRITALRRDLQSEQYSRVLRNVSVGFRPESNWIHACGALDLRNEVVHPYLTGRINRMVLESQLSYKIVNLLFTITNQNNELTIL